MDDDDFDIDDEDEDEIAPGSLSEGEEAELLIIAHGPHTEAEHHEFIDEDGDEVVRCNVCFARWALAAHYGTETEGTETEP